MARHDPHSPTTRLLFIGYVWPEPRSSAASGHVMQLLHCFLEQGWQITFASPASEGLHRAALNDLGITERHIELNSESFDSFVRELDPHVVVFDQFMIEEQFGWRVEKHCPNALRVLETSDLQSLRHARHQHLKALLATPTAESNMPSLFEQPHTSLFQRMAGSDLALREVAALYRCDLNLMTSDVEMQLLTTAFNLPPALLHWCPLMPEPALPTPPGFIERAHFLSIGNFRHAPNWDAVLWLKNAIWPLIRQQLPQAQLHIYGAYTPPKATALHNPAQGFHIMDWAEDALQVMAQARVCLAPLRFGAGIKGKLIDAMLCGTPSVTTPIGTEAMHGELPWPGLVATNAAAIAEAAVRLYRDQTRWEQAQVDGWRLLGERYPRDRHAASLIQRITELRDRLPAHRLANFTGAMLRHHQHKSTQYMAQWIEAKNRLA
ncbi:glycosyltransferase [Pseudomonas sp. DTU_2021_1001937_2_SI_NGA_ILE_001]|uniref:glycosyltransferase n=1 Tax=Pseudomonas sp. DTU_2021_1001937_2_SI_NGA_ILE_001 TaxID=3077589 RepID=UPI0028FC29BD|nr:glycosyltransferase [Pseudomonas sp. DTU_2021_1001937_2_SI_NGA_ILE_001]WNW10478.1 glycosyltransferase [Pseudomonas sp. DTU_2021_1001937_2_SI_NGA_ILE_001]